MPITIPVLCLSLSVSPLLKDHDSPDQLIDDLDDEFAVTFAIT